MLITLDAARLVAAFGYWPLAFSLSAFCNIDEMFASVKRQRQKTNKVKRAFNKVRRAIYFLKRGARRLNQRTIFACGLQILVDNANRT